ncbi:type III pantothenate kinase [Flavobacterium sp. CS20]|nr:type III pantothenate kinase [Flavobacterium sp. CS20]
MYPHKNVLVIDTGTCITYDFKSAENAYLGGNISPGLDMRFKALHQFTANLPRLKIEKPMTSPLGKTTKDAILNGVIQGVVYEIDQNITRYKSDYKDLTVILTGGDQQYLSAQLKNSIFANSTFQLVGLHAILEYLLND